jgi:sugar lactone lactonase YvrE
MRIDSARRTVLLAAAASAALLGAGCASDDASSPDQARMPADRIVAERGGFVPEGIEFDHRSRRLLTGSIAEGTIYEWHDDGRISPVVQDPELRASIGIRVDPQRNRLLVANSDASVFQGGGRGQAMLGVYDLANGQRLAMVDLAASDARAPSDARYFANDVAVAPDGTAYVTDSFSQLIYRVGLDYRASVLHRFPRGEEAQLLNGIAWHPSGYLLVVETNSGTLYRVPVDNPAATSNVALPEPVLGADGIVWRSDNVLAVVSNNQSRVWLLTSSNNWASADIAGVASFDGQATTAAVVDGEIYAVFPHFGDQDPPSVQRLQFR